MGELSVVNLYAVGKAMAEYCESKSVHPKLAVIGKPPTVTGFGANVASNRGLTSKTFSDSQSALNWLRALVRRLRGRDHAATPLRLPLKLGQRPVSVWDRASPLFPTRGWKVGFSDKCPHLPGKLGQNLSIEAS
jgi:hypothetical protein